MEDKRDVEIAANKAAQDLGYAALKPKQLEVVSGVLRGQDVFAVLPTGARAYIMSMMLQVADASVA